MNPSGIDAKESVAHRTEGLQRYALAIVSVAIALGVSLLLEQFHFRVPSALLLLSAVAITSWNGGLRAAILAAFLSIFSFYWYFVEPVRTIYIYWSQVPYFITFAAFAALLCWFGTVRRRAEKDLRNQAELLSLTHDSVVVMDVEGLIKYWNRGAEERYGWSAEQAVGKVAHALLGTVFPSPLEEIKAEVTRIGHWEGELLNSRKDGTQVVVASRWALQRNEHGAPVAILETSNDITERKRAEEALRRLNRELQAISSCNRVLLRATDEQTLLQEICRIVCEKAGYRMAWVGYAEHDEAKSVRPVAWTGAEEGFLANLEVTWADTERGRSPTGTAIRSGKTCCIQDFATDPRLAPWRERVSQHGFLSGIALPLKDEHADAFGTLSIYSEQPNHFTPEEVLLLEELAGDLAFGIVTLRSGAARTRAEEDLRRSEAYLAEAERLSHTGSFAWCPVTKRALHWSEEMFRIYGFDPQNGLPTEGQPLQRIHREDVDRFKRIWERTILEKVDDEGDFRIALPDGTVKHVHGTARPVLNAHGEVVEVIGTTIDITERKRAEEELRRSEAYLAEAQRLSHTGSYAGDSTTEPLYWSEELYRIFGFDPRHGLPGFDERLQRIHPEDRDRFLEVYHRAIREKVDAEVEYRILLPDGVVRHVRGTGHPVLSESGDLIEVVGTVVDITERKQAEESLRESEMRFRTFVDHAGDALFVQDLEHGTIVDVNRQACESLGYTRDELIGKTPLFFHMDADQAGVESAACRAAAGETVFDRHRHRRKDGSLFPVEVNTSCFWHGGRRFLLKVARDISDHVRAEEQREKLRQLEADLAHMDRLSMLGEMTASVTHELQQPIAAAALHAATCLQWLRRDPPNVHEAGEAGARIIDDANSAVEIVDRLRSLYKKSPPKRELVDVNQMIRQMVALLLGEANRHGVSIRSDVAQSFPMINADRVQLQQVLMNLMLNGIEAMHDMGGVLTVKSQPAQDDQVEILVSDTGVGLPADKADQIFNAFFTTKAQGSGMGLSISRSIIESHGGHIWATSNDGRGASFHFALPVATDAQVPAAVS